MERENVRIVLRGDDGEKSWRLFRNPERVLSAYRPEEVMSTLQAVQDAADDGLYAAGFLAYEAGPGLDKACETHSLNNLPLAWFGLFKDHESLELDQDAGADFEVGEWEPSVSAAEYRKVIEHIKCYLKAGDTYQVNYTFRLRADFKGKPWDLFALLTRTQRAEHCAFIETDDFAFCSASPELFFSLDGKSLVSRPMKGTARRGMTLQQDKELAEALHESEKNRAENIMIVDMVRNDMGRVAEPGTVHVPEQFSIERYPTVFQMTSEVESTTSAPFADIMKALFPCASITGAPKVRTMQIIKELEPEPRGIYTGCIGYLGPGRKAEFNVAIRTVHIDKERSVAEYGVGGGIVWDSDAENEYEECRVKAAVLTAEAPRFELLETLLWDGKQGYFLLEGHLARLRASAEYFGFNVDVEQIRERLMVESAGLGERKFRVRLCVGEDGTASIEKTSLPDTSLPGQWKMALAKEPVDSTSRFLYHKTTNRGVYERARLAVPGYDDALLWNERGEVTESTIANVVIEKDGRRVTPPVSSGLLPGVFRQWLLERGEIEEEVVKVDDLVNVDRIFLINSVRKWVLTVLSEQPSASRPERHNGALLGKCVR